jgi:hypothetical protein
MQGHPEGSNHWTLLVLRDMSRRVITILSGTKTTTVLGRYRYPFLSAARSSLKGLSSFAYFGEQLGQYPHVAETERTHFHNIFLLCSSKGV